MLKLSLIDFDSMELRYDDFKTFVTMFALHDEQDMAVFKHWWSFWDFPIQSVRDYFGEELGFYFAFSCHSVSWIAYLVVPSVLIGVYITLTGDNSGPHVAMFSLFILVWAALMTKYWSRSQSRLAIDWGMVELEEREKVRPSFKAQGLSPEELERNGGALHSMFVGGVKMVTSYKDRDLKDYIVASEINKSLRQILSFAVCLCLGSSILYCTSQVYAFQHMLEGDPTYKLFGLYLSPYSQYIATGLNLIQTLLFQAITRYVNYELTEFENHRTQTEFHDAVITKSCIFAFLTSFVSFFYIAFIAGNQIIVLFGYPTAEGCAGYDTCIEALSYNLIATVFAGLVRHFWSEFSFTKRLNTILNTNFLANSDPSQKLREGRNHIAIFAAQYYKFDMLGTDAKWDAMISYNYTAFFTEFGLMIFFLPVYPFAIVMIFISQWIEICGDMRVICKALRALPVSAADIGSFEGSFKLLVLLAVPINSATVMFTMNAFDPLIRSMADSFEIENHFSTLKIAVFLVLQFVVYLIVSFVSISIPDHVHDLKVNKDRTAQVISNLALIEQFEQEESKITKLQNTIQDNRINIARMSKEISILKERVKSLNDENEELKTHREGEEEEKEEDDNHDNEEKF